MLLLDRDRLRRRRLALLDLEDSRAVADRIPDRSRAQVAVRTQPAVVGMESGRDYALRTEPALHTAEMEGLVRNLHAVGAAIDTGREEGGIGSMYRRVRSLSQCQDSSRMLSPAVVDKGFLRTDRDHRIVLEEAHRTGCPGCSRDAAAAGEDILPGRLRRSSRGWT